MSKGNMLFSQARGKVGDLVFSRLDGEQIVRSRNRHPKNPKTNAQLFQRAIMATVLRAYSAGKMIFDHAFEGKQVGAQCQRAFLSLNAKRLRAAIAADLEAGNVGADCAARVVGPGVQTPVAAGFQVSAGSLHQDLFNSVGKLNGVGDVQNESISQYLARFGVVADDIFTVVAFTNSNPAVDENIVFSVNGVATVYGKQTVGDFLFARLRVKPEALASTTAISAATKLDAIFTLDAKSNFSVDLSTVTAADAILSATTFGTRAFLLTSGVIRSRENEDLRSDCILSWPSSDAAAYGITSDLLLRAWQQGATALGDSDLILEGGGDF